MTYIRFESMSGQRADYRDYGRAVPPYPRSTYITDVRFDRHRYHTGEGDMWPLTWGADDNIYAAAGDNRDSPMNFWRISQPKDYWNPSGIIRADEFSFTNRWICDEIDRLPIDPAFYCTDPRVHRQMGIKPAGLLDCAGTLYFAVETQNYGTDPTFNRQTNIEGWMITSTDYGKTWNRDATPQSFFSGRIASCHFLQFGRGYADARDAYVYAYFPAADDGNSYWENGDCMLLGRVPKEQMLVREAWEFYAGLATGNRPLWVKDDARAEPVFRYDKMTGENHVCYDRHIRRYLLGNYSFVDAELRPRPYHQGFGPEATMRSQLSLFEAPEPWGPWSLFYQDDDWGSSAGYQPSFPTKWMMDDGRTLLMVSSGSWDDYNFTVQRLALKLAGDSVFPRSVQSFF